MFSLRNGEKTYNVMKISSDTSMPQDYAAGTLPDVSEILPKLWIGRALHSADEASLLKSELGITAVVNLETDRDLDAAGLTWDKVRGWYATLGIAAHRMPIEGEWPASLIELMRRAMRLVSRLLKEGHVVYLHCAAGVNRSPTIALMYLNLVGEMPVEEALAIVQLRRPQAKPYEDVLVVLRALASRRG